MMRILVHLFVLMIDLSALRDASAEEASFLEEIRAVARRAVSLPGTPGLSVAVARGDEVLLAEGFGLADIENQVPVSAESVFRIGSVTKQFTAAAIMKLVEEGEVSLGDPLQMHYPEFETPGRIITLHQLLNHTSGIKSYTDLGEKWQETIRLDLSHEELLDLVEDEPFDFEPGTGWSYNNSGYYLLGVVIEEVTAETYQEYMDDAFFEPLEMESTRIGSHSDIIPHRVRGYEFVGRHRSLFALTPGDGGILRNADYISMSQPGGAGALLSTARDLVRWQRGLVTGQVITEDSYAKMTEPEKLPGGKNPGYGYGLVVDELDGHRRVAHGGGINGFAAQLSYYPDKEITVVVLANSTAQPVHPIESSIARIALGGGE